MRLESIDTHHSDTVALLRGPLVLMAVKQRQDGPVPKMKRDHLLSARRVSERQWESTSADGLVTLLPFTSLGDRPYTTYVTLAWIVGARDLRVRKQSISSGLFDTLALKMQQFYPTPSNHIPGGQFIQGTVGSEGETQNNFYTSVQQSTPYRKYFGRLDYDIAPTNPSPCPIRRAILRWSIQAWYLRDKQPSLAIPELQAAVDIDLDSVDAQANLGVLLFFQGKAPASLALRSGELSGAGKGWDLLAGW
jgi:hypothetical protein